MSARPDPGVPPPPSPRQVEVSEALAALRARVDAACAAARRDPADVCTVVVTKTFPAADVAVLAGLGVRDVGEARDQEARAKRAELGLDAATSPPAAAPSTSTAAPPRVPADLRWHFLGRLQRNKAASVAGWADLVHSCDGVRLADALAAGARRVGRTLPVLLQVGLDEGGRGAPDRGGAPVADVRGLADHVAGLPGLRLDGVMAVAPREGDPVRAFALLAEVAADVRSTHPDARVVSAGMSGDLEAAVAAGATHLRVGRAVLGSRPALG